MVAAVTFEYIRKYHGSLPCFGRKGIIMEEREHIQEEKEVQKNAKERLYDKVPLSYKQVDIITKVLIAVFVLLMLYFIVTSHIWR